MSRELKFLYDEGADVLYVSLGHPEYTYYRETDTLWPDYNYIIVVVKLVRNNFVITAYPKFIGR